MDSKRFHEAHRRLQQLDERMSYKVRTASAAPLGAPTLDTVGARQRDLAAFALELKEIVSELFDSIAAKS